MRSSRSLLLLTLALGLALTGCPKKDDASSTSAPSASAADTVSAAPSASASAAPSASALAGTGADDAGTPTAASATATAATAATAAAGTGAATGATAKGSDGAGVCGKKPLPDCPLQHWMKENTAAAMASNDLPSVATALDKVVKFAPAGYTNWSSIAKDGADAARAGKLDAVKNACRTCHDQYKNKYKSELRTRPVPGQ
jgi:hypothetical protein